MKNYLLYASLAINLLVAMFWCQLHKIAPCGTPCSDNVTAPVTVTTTQTFDSATVELPPVAAPSPVSTKWEYHVSAIETERDQLAKQLRSDSLALVRLRADASTNAQQNKLLRQFIDGLTRKDTNALVHRALFERTTETKTFRNDSIAAVDVTTTVFQNRIEAQKVAFKRLSPTANMTVTNHYSDRFLFSPGLQFMAVADMQWNNVTPMAGIDLNFKFKTNTSVSPGYAIGPNAQMVTLRINQLIRFPAARAAIERRKIRKAAKNNP
jgi:hypothetical protein